MKIRKGVFRVEKCVVGCNVGFIKIGQEGNIDLERAPGRPVVF